MKKTALFVLGLIALLGGAYGVEITYTVTQDSNLRELGNLLRMVGTVREGEMVFYQGRVGRNAGIFEILVRTERGWQGWIDSRNVLSQGSQPLPSFITDKMWIPSFYQQFLNGAEIETMFDYEPFWRDEYDDHIWGIRDPPPWWWSAATTGFEVRDNVVYITGIYTGDFIRFATISQRQDGSTVTLRVICEHRSNRTPQNRFNSRFSTGGIYQLTLMIDGDYMDVFVDDDADAIARLVGVDLHFRNSVRDVFRGEPVDLSRIVWPRRADGSMDFPPHGIDMSDFEASHMKTTRLRVRDNPYMESLIVTTLDTGMEAKVLEEGSVATIGGITASWARVLTANGFTGWAFSGFLEPIAVEPEYPDPVVAEAPEEQVAPIAVATPAGQPIPPLSAFVAVAVAAIAVILLVKRKKKPQRRQD